jgi:hypothetical protein
LQLPDGYRRNELSERLATFPRLDVACPLPHPLCGGNREERMSLVLLLAAIVIGYRAF